MDLKLYRMYLLGIPQERIALRLGETRERVRNHLADPAILPKRPNADLQKGFTVSQTAEKHGWPESLVWALKLEGKDDAAKCHELQWGIRTWDNWYFTD
jgi:hypothetical protein